MRNYFIIAACCVVIVGSGVWFVSKRGVEPPAGPGNTSGSATMARKLIPPEKVIDYGKIKGDNDKALTALMKERKAPYGVKNSLDMIVKSDESIKVGEKTVRMKRILDEVRLKQGEILETDLGTEKSKEKPSEYGIHVVKQTDNVWDIHFKLLRDYYEHKAIHVSPVADEPDQLGRSSGVGKILKFSEHMVHIYNLREHRLETDLNHIYPLTKVVVYNMSYIFALLDRINYKDVHRIQFDGETLWLPAEL